MLDFGIARTTDHDLQTVTFGTSAGQIIGTLAYMSPEQIVGDSAQVDTRSDVYSLGVVLYELLAGRLPHDVTTCSIAEAARKIKDEDPARLATIHRSLSGDLEMLAAKALAKDKARRYQSAADLGGDLRRYLAGEPIEARRDSSLTHWYLLKKALARHRAAAIGALAFVVLLAASTVALAFMYQGQVSERQRADAAATRARAVTHFLGRMLITVDPHYGDNSEVTVRQVVAQAVGEIESGSLKGQPELEATLMGTLGQTYIGLGLYAEAEPLLLEALERRRRLFGERSEEAGDMLHELGVLRHEQGRQEEALALLDEALAIRRELLGPTDLQTANVLHNRVAVYDALNDLERAEDAVREVLSIRQSVLPAHDPDLILSLNGLASILKRRGHAEEAERIYRDIVAIDRRLFAGRLVPLSTTLNNLAFAHQSRGEYVEAEALYRDALDICRRSFIEGHPAMATELTNLGALLRDMGKPAEAEPYAREAYDIRRKALPAGHTDIARSALLLGTLLHELGRSGEAEPPLRECWTIRKASMKEGHHLIAESASTLGDCLTALGRYHEAEPLLVESYPLVKAGRGETHARTLDALRRLVRHFEARGLPERAAEYRGLLPAEDTP